MRLMRFNATAEHAPGKTLALADAEDTLRTHTVLRHKKVVKRLFEKWLIYCGFMFQNMHFVVCKSMNRRNGYFHSTGVRS